MRFATIAARPTICPSFTDRSPSTCVKPTLIVWGFKYSSCFPVSQFYMPLFRCSLWMSGFLKSTSLWLAFALVFLLFVLVRCCESTLHRTSAPGPILSEVVTQQGYIISVSLNTFCHGVSASHSSLQHQHPWFVFVPLADAYLFCYHQFRKKKPLPSPITRLSKITHSLILFIRKTFSSHLAYQNFLVSKVYIKSFIMLVSWLLEMFTCVCTKATILSLHAVWVSFFQHWCCFPTFASRYQVSVE